MTTSPRGIGLKMKAAGATTSASPAHNGPHHHHRRHLEIGDRVMTGQFARLVGPWLTAAEQPIGMASYMREDAPNGVVKIGAIAHASALARTVAATEAHYLLMGHVFALGSRSCEWKCDNANEPSKRAAKQLGFTYEGVFRQHSVRHGHNHDTAWYSIVDHEWPNRKEGFECWLDDANFDNAGNQRQPLNLSTP